MYYYEHYMHWYNNSIYILKNHRDYYLITISGTVNSAMSMPNLASDRSPSTTNYMPSAGETKKKKGFFSFLKKDNSKKFSVVSK